WAISGYVDGDGIIPWMSIAPTAQGTIAANGSAQANITFNIEHPELPYSGKLYVYSNDLNNDLNILNVTVVVTDGVEENEAIRISIYPNPASDVLNIASESINRVEVFNMAGQRVWAGDYSENEISIATSNWAPGTYMVKVTANGNAKVEKIIVR
ncbi:MAG: T9SS type A sorting domain-containing protein, partial [Bacteroidales bacterium]|nr:T9SS type A sorting domain-containing protein [Bacteroidales bacterium]